MCFLWLISQLPPAMNGGSGLDVFCQLSNLLLPGMAQTHSWACLLGNDKGSKVRRFTLAVSSDSLQLRASVSPHKCPGAQTESTAVGGAQFGRLFSHKALVQSPAPFKRCTMGYANNPSTQRVEAEEDIRSARSAWVIKCVQGQCELYKNCLEK